VRRQLPADCRGKEEAGVKRSAAHPQLRPATPQDAKTIQVLLESCALPTADLDRSRPDFIVAHDEETVMGVGGLERFGAPSLLRSVAVAPDYRACMAKRL
jgi:N-acetylglutamate synthase-like GNAT family acetyltransferase